VREAEALARRTAGRDNGRPAVRPSRQGAKDADTRALEDDLTEVLGLTVEVADRGGMGELRIHYTSLEQLDDICRRLTKG
jgi:ParB family chromosome partitioning protein